MANNSGHYRKIEKALTAKARVTCGVPWSFARSSHKSQYYDRSCVGAVRAVRDFFMGAIITVRVSVKGGEWVAWRSRCPDGCLEGLWRGTHGHSITSLAPVISVDGRPSDSHAEGYKGHPDTTRHGNPGNYFFCGAHLFCQELSRNNGLIEKTFSPLPLVLS